MPIPDPPKPAGSRRRWRARQQRCRARRSRDRDLRFLGVRDQAGQLTLDMTGDAGGPIPRAATSMPAGWSGVFLSFSSRASRPAASMVPARWFRSAEATSKTLGECAPLVDRLEERRAGHRLGRAAAQNTRPTRPRAGGHPRSSLRWLRHLRDAPPEQLCDRVLLVYDGSRVSRRRSATGCRQGRLHRVGSYARIRAPRIPCRASASFPFDLVATGSGGIAQLQRIETSTGFGRAVLQRRLWIWLRGGRDAFCPGPAVARQQV